MKYKITITMSVESGDSEDSVVKKFAALFNFGTVKESIVDALGLLKDPGLINVFVEGRTPVGRG